MEMIMMKLKPKSNYVIERYDADGIFTCDNCHTGVLACCGYDVSIDNPRCEFMGSYCEKCTKKLLCEPEPVSKPRSECLTYNDIINALSFIMEKAENEAISEVDHISILECEITNLISRLQSESPSQTPSP